MIRIKQSPDYFLNNKKVANTTIPYKHGEPISYYLKDINLEKKRVVILGKRVTDFTIIPQDDIEIIITPIVEDPITAIILVVAVVAGYKVFQMIFPGVDWFSFLKPRTPSFNGVGADESSPTYSWDGIRTLIDIGVPVPVIYGRHKIGGNVINQFLRVNTVDAVDKKDVSTEKTYLNLLLALCEGEISGISNIKINGNPIENYDGVESDYRLGTNDQSIIPEFGDLHNLQDMSVNLTSEDSDPSYTYTTVRNDIKVFELYLTFPQGLFRTTGSGGVKSWDVTFRVEYKLHTDSVFIDLGETTITAKNRSNFKRIYRKGGLEAGQYDIRVTRTSDDSDLTHVGDMSLTSVDEIITDDLSYPNTALLSIKALATDQLSGSTPDISCVVEGKKVLMPRVTQGGSSEEIITVEKNILGAHRGIQQNILELLREDNVVGCALDSVSAFEIGDSITLPEISEDPSFEGTFVVTNKDSEWNVLYWNQAGEYADIYDCGFILKALEDSKSYLKVADLSGLEIGMAFDVAGCLDSSFDGSFIIADLITEGSNYYIQYELDGTPSFVGEGGTISYEEVSEGDSGSVETVIPWEDYYWNPVTEKFELFYDGSECDWDGVTFEEQWGANPIWCLLDFITNTRYGLGNDVVINDTDEELHLAMAKYCEEKVNNGKGGWEKRYRMDVVLDAQAEPMDWFQKLATLFDGILFYSQGKIALRIDKLEDRSQSFGMGSIVNGSFQQSIKSIRDIPNIVEIQYLNEDKDYIQDSIIISDDESLNAGNPPRVKRMRAYTTKTSSAMRIGMRLLKAGKLSRKVNFKVGIGGIGCQPGDVIGVSNDIPLWGYSGRTKTDSTTSLIKLDHSIALETDKIYHILVKFEDDTSEERLVTNVPGNFSELTISPALTKAPPDFCEYFVGPIETINKPFRILGMTMDNRNEVAIQASEYDDDVYNYDNLNVPIDNYSELSFEIPLVENLSLKDHVVKLSDGTIENSIDVFFSKPEIGNRVRGYRAANIYLSDNDGNSWEYKGQTSQNSFSIVGGIESNTTYRVVVTSISSLGEERVIAGSPQRNIFVVGKAAPPSNVTGFIVNQNRDRLTFYWNAVGDVDLKGYEIRYGSDWDSGTAIAEFTTGTSFSILDFTTGEDQSYWIKAIDTSGNYSISATEATITINNIPFSNIVKEFFEQDSWSGTTDNTVVYDSAVRISEGEMSGIYTTPVRDNGYIATFKVGIRAVATKGGHYTLQSFPGLGLQDLPGWTLKGPKVLPGMVTFRIRTSEDNVVWSEWQGHKQADYYCRYFQLEMTLTRESVTDDIVCSELYYFTDLPDVDEFGLDEVTVAAAGKAIVFNKTFHENPSVNIDIRSGDGVFHKFIAAPDVTGFTIKLYDISGNEETGEFSYHAHGI